MKMLGFMIAMTLAYWAMASYAKSVIAGAEPAPAEAELATIDSCGEKPVNPVQAAPVVALGAYEGKDSAARHLVQVASAQQVKSCGN